MKYLRVLCLLLVCCLCLTACTTNGQNDGSTLARVASAIGVVAMLMETLPDIIASVEGVKELWEELTAQPEDPSLVDRFKEVVALWEKYRDKIPIADRLHGDGLISILQSGT